MFFGSHEHVLDEKGRTSLPKEFRDALSRLEGQAWLTAYPHCLAILPEAAFSEWFERLSGEHSRISDAIQHLRRLIIGMASSCNIDRQGRILIPPSLRSHAGLERDLVFMGVGNEIEIWDKSRHKGEIEHTGANYARYTREILRGPEL